MVGRECRTHSVSALLLVLCCSASVKRYSTDCWKCCLCLIVLVVILLLTGAGIFCAIYFTSEYLIVCQQCLHQNTLCLLVCLRIALCVVVACYLQGLFAFYSDSFGF